jgi:hypothetical protein
MLKVVRSLFVLQCRGILLAAWLFLVTASVSAQASVYWLAASKPLTVAHANAKLTKFGKLALTADPGYPGEAGFAESRVKEVDAPDSTPTFSTAHPLFLIAAKDFVVPGDDDRAKLKNEVKAPEPDKPALPGNVPLATDPNSQFGEQAGFQWRSAWRQSLMFLGIQHAFRLMTEESTRADLKGPFFKDYLTTLTKLRGWDDGDPFIVNYIGHPMMGSVTGYIQVQNDPRGIHREVGFNKDYFKSRLKAFGWSFLYSTQFEIGPVSEASLGNIGIRPTKESKHAMAYVDIVVTPLIGTGWLVGEDLIDKYLIRRLDTQVNNKVARVLLRSFLNPTRSMANFLRGKYPWYRDDRSF